MDILRLCALQAPFLSLRRSLPTMLARSAAKKQRHSANIDSSLAELSCRSIFLSCQKPSVGVVSQLPLVCLSSCRCSLPPSVLGLCRNT